MATTYTTNYNLGKQENHADKFDMDVITDNADKIDAALTAKADKSTTYTKTEVDTALSGKQATLTTAQLAAVNSGITSAGVEQIETNKTNILLNARNGVSNYINSADVTISASGYVLNALDCNIPQGDYYIKYTSTQTVSGNIQATLKDANNTTVCDTTTTSTSGDNLIPITLSDTAKTITIYSVRAGTYSNLQIIPKSLYDAGFTDFMPYAMSNAELTNIAVPLSGKTVLNVQANTSQTATYQMLGADFGDKRSCGVYLIYIVSWSTSPVLSVYAAYYSGGVTTYSAVTKIAGADATVSVSGDTISVTSSGKIQIIAMQ